MQDKAKGTVLSILSAVFYGLNPLFAKTIIASGSNAMTLSFARVCSGAVLFGLFHWLGEGKSFAVTQKQRKDILICCLGYALIGPLLFASYRYLASGLATTIHFVYPVLVVAACIAFRYEKASRRKIVCCALCFLGILCFYTPGGEVSAYGVLLAFASGVVWAFYIVHLNASGVVGEVPPFLLAFWLSVYSAVILGVLTAAGGQLAWPATPLGWGAMGIYGGVTAAASLLFLVGNKYIGA